MFCRNCGANIPNDAQFCPNCGSKCDAAPAPAPQPQPQPQPQQPYQPYQTPTYSAAPQQPYQPYGQQPYQPAYQPEAPKQNIPEAGPILTFGVLSLIFSGLLGLIFACVSKSKLKQYRAAGGEVTGKAKAGNILATLGLVFSIIALIGSVIFLISLIAGGAAAFPYLEELFEDLDLSSL